ncbi:unnamed protein product [Caenorhabditis nigoni]
MSGLPRVDLSENTSGALEEEPRVTSRELAASLNHPQRTIIDHLHESGRVPNLLMIHDNARPPTILKTRQELQMLGVKNFCYSSYSPDLALTEYQLIRPLKNLLVRQKFHDRKDVKKWLDDVFAS